MNGHGVVQIQGHHFSEERKSYGRRVVAVFPFEMCDAVGVVGCLQTLLRIEFEVAAPHWLVAVAKEHWLEHRKVKARSICFFGKDATAVGNNHVKLRQPLRGASGAELVIRNCSVTRPGFLLDESPILVWRTYLDRTIIPESEKVPPAAVPKIEGRRHASYAHCGCFRSTG